MLLNPSKRRWLLVLIALVLTIGGVQIFEHLLLVRAASPVQYKVVASPGRDVPLAAYEKTFNDMAKQGWKFDQWVYRGSVQTPDLLFKKE